MASASVEMYLLIQWREAVGKILVDIFYFYNINNMHAKNVDDKQQASNAVNGCDVIFCCGG